MWLGWATFVVLEVVSPLPVGSLGTAFAYMPWGQTSPLIYQASGGREPEEVQVLDVGKAVGYQYLYSAHACMHLQYGVGRDSY